MSRRLSRLPALLILVIASAAAPGRLAAQVSTHITYDEHIKKSKTFAALDENLFGDKVSLQDGAVSFSQDDVVLTTNSALRVAIGRKSTTQKQWSSPQFPVFGFGWDLNVPYMMGTYDTRDGWNAWNSTNPNPSAGRCTAGAFTPRERVGPWPYYYTQLIYAHMYWNGVNINIPGQGQEQALKLNSAQVVPTDGKTYYGTTKSHWKIGCLPSIKNGVGEGFTTTTSDGVTYYFDWMVKRKAVDLTDNKSVDSLGNGYEPWHLLAPLTDVYLYATKAVDRFGNSVTYTYDAAYPNRITKIHSSDGAQLDVNYNLDGLVSTITVGSRTWSYAYNGRVLTSLQIPDGSKWLYSGEFSLNTEPPEVYNFWSNGCGMDAGFMSAASVPSQSTLNKITITHPSGAKGDFTFRPLYHGTNNAPGGCGLFGSAQTSLWWGTWGIPSAYGVMSLYEKKISGSGMSDRTWSYAYAPSWSFQSQCGSGCASTSQTAVTTNDGVVRRYTYGNDYFSNHGQLLSETVEKSNAVVKSSAYTYMTTASGQPFPDNTGDIAKANGLADLYGNPFKFKNRPLTSASTLTDGVTFSRTNTAFDLFARTTTVTRQNSLGYSKSDVTEYHDNLNSWVLGQVKRQYNIQTGMVMSQIDYNSQALPWKIYDFGKLRNTLTYNADGTLATVADGLSNTIALSVWKRGIPQHVQYPVTPEAPSGATQSALVDNNGWITSVTDENGYATGYGYDAVGRLASIAYPTGDSVAWLPKTFEFRALTAADWLPPGISVGQWRQHEGQGNYAKFTYYDAMWRPILVHEYDAANVGPTLRSTRTTYDASGHQNFQSYPTSDLTPGNNGSRTYYDALDRVTKVEQDSEHGVLSTFTEYLGGLQVRVTNPRGHQTTTGFMAWDQPGYDLPLWSSQPEGKVVEIARHPQFGWPLQLKQRSADNSLQQVRSYVYDGHAQLCKTIEPETGATVTGFDAASNPVWSASGLTGGTYASTTDCSYMAANASGRVVNRLYDARNRITTLNFPDGRGNQIWTYEKDGQAASVTAYNDANNTTPVVTAYTYNKRRMLKGESLSQPGWYTWGIGYEYDPIGNLRWQSYPTGLSLDYAPNALGQSTGVRDQNNKFYASNASYYPNGAAKQFTYGNGIVHAMTQNARQLPSRVTSSSGVLDYTYFYDANGNPEHIANELVNGYDPRDRWMQYDALDRLTAAGSASFGGDHWHRFTYDALDNLKSWKLSGVKDYADYVYDAQHRLANIRNTAGATVVGLSYDVQGNLSNKNGQIYEFDYGNRLRGVISKEYYRYDGLGRRVLNWRYPTASIPNGTLSLSQYSQSGQLMYQEDYHSTPAVASEHIYLAGSLIATRENVWGVSAAIKYQHTDALGSPVAVTNEAGQVVERNDYEPYGAIIGKPDYNGIGYTGHMMDGATRLTYMQQRYYDPSIGRFLSVDPVTAHGGDYRHFNRYTYAYNNPYAFVDPDGRQGKQLGRVIRALWESGGDSKKFEAKMEEYKRQDRMVLDTIVDLTAVGPVKDAVEIGVKVANDQDAAGKSSGVLAGEIAEKATEAILDKKIGDDNAEAAGSVVGKYFGDLIETVVDHFRQDDSSNDTSNKPVPTPEPKPDPNLARKPRIKMGDE